MSCGSIDIEDISNTIPKTEYQNKHAVPDEDAMKELVKDLLKYDLNVSNDKIDKYVNKIKRKYKISPSKTNIRNVFDKYFSEQPIPYNFKRWMIKKATRSDSGVLVVTITLSPHQFSCKYDCFYCPQEKDLDGNFTQPRSYLSNEPAMLRALQFNFDVRGQFWNRIESYLQTGNIMVDDYCHKMEVILSGGTWESYPIEYRERIINELYWSANTFSNPRKIKSLDDEIKENETAKYRIIGLTLETRPDNITPESIRDYRRWGVTRMQIGVQHFDNVILKKINRKCYTPDTIRAIKLLKQCGFKVVIHLMPDLPGSNPELDKWMFDQSILNPDLLFDDLKIYPTAICKTASPSLIVTSKIADWYKDGLFTPYGETNINDLIDVLIHYKRQVQPWVRIQRLVRDIPSTSIEAGYKKCSNLRQVIIDKMKKDDIKCKCIRCMEINHTDCDINSKAYLVVRKYKASDGMEYHISMETYDFNIYDIIKYYLFQIFSMIIWFLFAKKIYWSGNIEKYKGLYGFLRLRIDKDPGGDIIPEINDCGLVREVHVYGNSLGVGDSNSGTQHRGYGKILLDTAEFITIMNGFSKVAVISGVGTREYYKNKCGYRLQDTYMIKNVKYVYYNFWIIIIILMIYHYCYYYFKY